MFGQQITNEGCNCGCEGAQEGYVFSAIIAYTLPVPLDVDFRCNAETDPCLGIGCETGPNTCICYGFTPKAPDCSPLAGLVSYVNGSTNLLTTTGPSIAIYSAWNTTPGGCGYVCPPGEGLTGGPCGGCNTNLGGDCASMTPCGGCAGCTFTGLVYECPPGLGSQAPTKDAYFDPTYTGPPAFACATCGGFNYLAYGSLNNADYLAPYWPDFRGHPGSATMYTDNPGAGSTPTDVAHIVNSLIAWYGGAECQSMAPSDTAYAVYNNSSAMPYGNGSCILSPFSSGLRCSGDEKVYYYILPAPPADECRAAYFFITGADWTTFKSWCAANPGDCDPAYASPGACLTPDPFWGSGPP